MARTSTRSNRNNTIRWEFISAFAAFFVVLMIGLSVNPSFTGFATYSPYSSYVSCTKVLAYDPIKANILEDGACFVQHDKIVKVSNINTRNNVYGRKALIQLYDKYALEKEGTIKVGASIKEDEFEVTLYTVYQNFFGSKKAFISVEWPRFPSKETPSSSYADIICNDMEEMPSSSTSKTFTNILPGECIKYKDYLIKKVGEYYAIKGLYSESGEGVYLELWKKLEDGRYEYKKYMLYKKIGTGVVLIPVSGKLEFENLIIEPVKRNYIRDVVFDLVVSYSEETQEEEIPVEHPLAACRYDYNADGKVAVADISLVASNNGKTGNNCYLGSKRLQCSVFDGNRDGVINNDDLPNAFIGKECPIINFDYGDGNDKIESSLTYPRDGYYWNQRYKQGAPNYNRDCVEEDNNCLNYDLDADYKLTINDLYMLQKYDGKVLVQTPTLPQTPTCTDSDNGIEYGVNGYVRYSNIYYNDICSGDYLREYYCNSGVVASDYHACENGCEYGICKSAPTCVENDGGRTYGTKGMVTGTDASGAWKTVTDYCSSSSVLKEYYCATTGSRYSYILYDCIAHGFVGCSNGICITSGTTTGCTDTDAGTGDGINYNEKGTVTNPDGEDSCYSGKWLREYYCQTDGTSTSKAYVCPGSCSNGKCV